MKQLLLLFAVAALLISVGVSVWNPAVSAEPQTAAIAFETTLAQGGLVTCSGTGCNLCHIVSLLQNIITFLIQLAVSVSALLFAYAGFLYLSASTNPGRVAQAHKIFTNVGIGLVVMLSAWLIVNLIMVSLLDDSIGARWNTFKVDCPNSGTLNAPDSDRSRGARSDTSENGVTARKPRQSSTLSAEKLQREQQARNRITRETDGRVTVNKSPCPDGLSYKDVAGGCTDVGGFSERVLTRISSLATECDCEYEITGGTELGHTCNSQTGTHCSGDKFDASPDAPINTFVETSVASGRFEEVTDTECFGDKCYLDTYTGDFWVRENAGRQNDHWDIEPGKEPSTLTS